MNRNVASSYAKKKPRNLQKCRFENIDWMAAEDERVTERAAQYDLISFNQKLARLREIAAAQRQQTEAIIQTQIAQAEADAAATKGDQERDAALRRIGELEAQLARQEDQYYQHMQQISDQFYEHQMQRAEQATNVMSEAFTRAFGMFLTEHTNLKTVMEKFWVDMVVGFERMGLQIVANEIKSIAMRTIAEATGVQQVTAIHAAGANEAAAVSEAGSIWQVLASAKSAAAGAYSAMAGIPYVGPELGAAAAAAVFAAVLAIGGTGGGGAGAGGGTVGVDATGGIGGGIPGAVSAAGGALVHSDGLFQLHEGEIVVPKTESRMLMESGSLQKPDQRSGAPSSLIDQYGIKTTNSTLPESIRKSITNIFSNSTNSTGSSVVAASMNKLLSNVSMELASAANGMIVPGDMIAQVHEKETILPARLSEGVQRLVAGESPSRDETHNHNTSVTHHNHFEVGGMTKGEITKHMEEIGPTLIKKWQRQGKIKYRG